MSAEEACLKDGYFGAHFIILQESTSYKIKALRACGLYSCAQDKSCAAKVFGRESVISTLLSK